MIHSAAVTLQSVLKIRRGSRRLALGLMICMLPNARLRGTGAARARTRRNAPAPHMGPLQPAAAVHCSRRWTATRSWPAHHLPLLVESLLSKGRTRTPSTRPRLDRDLVRRRDSCDYRSIRGRQMRPFGLAKDRHPSRGNDSPSFLVARHAFAPTRLRG
jgi:hypothetical protein